MFILIFNLRYEWFYLPLTKLSKCQQNSTLGVYLKRDDLRKLEENEWARLFPEKTWVARVNYSNTLVAIGNQWRMKQISQSLLKTDISNCRLVKDLFIFLLFCVTGWIDLAQGTCVAPSSFEKENLQCMYVQSIVFLILWLCPSVDIKMGIFTQRLTQSVILPMRWKNILTFYKRGRLNIHSEKIPKNKCS